MLFLLLLFYLENTILKVPEAKRSCLGSATPTEYTPAASPTLTEVCFLLLHLDVQLIICICFRHSVAFLSKWIPF